MAGQAAESIIRQIISSSTVAELAERQPFRRRLAGTVEALRMNEKQNLCVHSVHTKSYNILIYIIFPSSPSSAPR